MSIVLVGSTSGSITLQEPAVAGTTVLDLPATSGTVLVGGTQNIPKASLPTGSVLQVVSTVNSTNYSGTSGAEVYTGVAASITPLYSSSKILVIYQIAAGATSGGTNAAYQLLLRRGTTTGATLLLRARCGGYSGGAVEAYATMILSALDSPATTSSVTYGVFQTNVDGTNTWSINANSGISNLTLMEIAA